MAWDQAIVMGILGIIFYLHLWVKESFDTKSPAGKAVIDGMRMINLILIWFLSAITVRIVVAENPTQTDLIGMLSGLNGLVSTILWIFIVLYGLMLLYQGVIALKNMGSKRRGD